LIILFEGGTAEVTPLLRDLTNSKMTLENIGSHLSLKAVALVLVTPFFCSSLVETVQSSIASETPGVLDSLQEGFARAGHWRTSRSTRLLPIWLLVGPTVLYGLFHYTIYSSVRSSCVWIYQRGVRRRPNEHESIEESAHSEAMSSLIASLMADAILFPLETILHRLCLQGTRTIIDNVEQTAIVTPVISDYDGIGDCYRSIVAEEGSSGLLKGFGALVLQYAFHYALIKLTRLVVQQISPALK